MVFADVALRAAWLWEMRGVHNLVEQLEKGPLRIASQQF